MQVEQITYGSLNRSRMKGYQIIGKSAGIDSQLGSAFCRWAPSHNSLQIGEEQEAEEACGLSFFPLDEDHFAIARSVHGGPEYSGRGGASVVTSALVLTGKQMAQCGWDPVATARTALALGHLILPLGRDEVLDRVTLPRRPFDLPPPESDVTDSTVARLPPHAVNWVAREICSLVGDTRRVLIIGHCDPLPILTLLFEQLEPPMRMAASFGFGLNLSSRREFQVQFVEQPLCPKQQKEFSRSDTELLDLSRLLSETN